MAIEKCKNIQNEDKNNKKQVENINKTMTKHVETEV